MARFQAVTCNHFKSFHDLILGRDFSKGIKSDPANWMTLNRFAPANLMTLNRFALQKYILRCNSDMKVMSALGLEPHHTHTRFWKSSQLTICVQSSSGFWFHILDISILFEMRQFIVFPLFRGNGWNGLKWVTRPSSSKWLSHLVVVIIPWLSRSRRSSACFHRILATPPAGPAHVVFRFAQNINKKHRIGASHEMGDVKCYPIIFTIKHASWKIVGWKKHHYHHYPSSWIPILNGEALIYDVAFSILCQGHRNAGFILYSHYGQWYSRDNPWYPHCKHCSPIDTKYIPINLPLHRPFLYDISIKSMRNPSKPIVFPWKIHSIDP